MWHDKETICTELDEPREGDFIPILLSAIERQQRPCYTHQAPQKQKTRGVLTSG